MIQIICCSCTQQKLRRNGVDFYSNKRFYQNIEEMFVAPCSTHPFIKERIGSRFIDVICNCANLEKGRCNNCKIICYHLIFLADKIKIARFGDVPAEVEIKTIEQYLSDIQKRVIFCFCCGCFKVQ